MKRRLRDVVNGATVKVTALVCFSCPRCISQYGGSYMEFAFGTGTAVLFARAGVATMLALSQNAPKVLRYSVTFCSVDVGTPAAAQGHSGAAACWIPPPYVRTYVRTYVAPQVRRHPARDHARIKEPSKKGEEDSGIMVY